MNKKEILEKILPIRDKIWEFQSTIDSLIATLREEEVIDTLTKRKQISTAKLQREYNMGYSTASMLLDNLIEKGYIKRIKKSGDIKYEILKK